MSHHQFTEELFKFVCKGAEQLQKVLYIFDGQLGSYANYTGKQKQRNFFPCPCCSMFKQ